MSGRIGALKTLGRGCDLSDGLPSAPMTVTVGLVDIMAVVVYVSTNLDTELLSQSL